MYGFEDAEVQITVSEILSKISELDIFIRYCSNFIELDKSFCSELRIDKSPSCRIYTTKYNTFRYKDFAGNGDNLDCWNYVMKKYNCTYYEALNIISNDFNIKSIRINLDPKIILINDEIKARILKPREKSRIDIIAQPWTLIDYEYWNQYYISFDLLNEYNVFSSKYVYLTKGDKRYTSEYTSKNPCYAYRFTNEAKYTYKIYFPMSEKNRKWLFSGGASDDIEGYDQLPLHGDTLILTKSLKDCMVYNILGLPAISLQGEANKLEQELVNKLLKRFNRIVVNYDYDEQGIKSTNSLVRQYNFDHYYINKHKDLSDYIKNEGLNSAGQMIKNKINEIKNRI